MPVWKWCLLLIGAIFLSIIGYALIVSFTEVGNYIGYPSMAIIGSVVVLALYAVFVRLFEGHWPRDLRLWRLIPHTALGLLVGAVFMTLVVSIIVAIGCASVDWYGSSWQEQWTAIMLFLGVAVGEEIMDRGVIFRLIDERWNTTAALIISALIFGFSHMPNDNATWWSSLAIAIEAGLLLAAAYKWSGSLWLPIGIHWAWNYVQGNVFGFAVSGNVFGGHILAPTVDNHDLITGGAFGPEASIIAVLLGAFFTLVFLFTRPLHYR